MIYLKTDDEIELIRESNQLIGKTLAQVAEMIAPGVKTIALDKMAEEFIRSHNAVPSFLGYSGFPYSLCISVNEVVVHGFPSDYELKEGDIVSVDCGVYKNGYHGDSAYTFAVGEISEDKKQLLRTTRESLYKGIEAAQAGNRIGDIGFAVQSYCERRGCSVVRDLVGHGVGRDLHEDPQVPNYGKRGLGKKLQDGLVIAIEPMINAGVKDVVMWEDGWSIATRDSKPSAHFEHTICVRKGKADILSTFEFVEDVLKRKGNFIN